METLHNGFTLELCDDAFPLSTDSIALADFVKLGKNATVLDLGSGCGTLGLLLCSKDAHCAVTGIELEENSHKMALRNAAANNISSRFSSICGDVVGVDRLIAPGSFSCCVSNPPYFSSGPASAKTPLARRDDRLPPEALFRAASWSLQYGGDLFLVHKPEMLAHLCVLANQHQLELKRLCLLRHKEDSPVSLILMHFKKGGKPGLIWLEEALFHSDGTPTAYYQRLYRS